jgi:hypothetical protein
MSASTHLLESIYTKTREGGTVTLFSFFRSKQNDFSDRRRLLSTVYTICRLDRNLKADVKPSRSFLYGSEISFRL